ncbi:Lrp/AsnC family transcriptional regulator [Pacificimonas sp. WHA3]|uniref:Lrp/AsnC family transcriptional regulator n=2 Tax=Pacificimonas pallii TaxID=2827236 RepID=A0ABS6SF78_9SPHN|nr:Lrp/AsnC family transcriptional regulator [Pacificimonas pallii]
MDRLDLAIIRELQRDGRLTNQALAERVGLSPSPCLRRLRALEKSGTIRGYTALVDPRAVGLTITVFIRITLDRHSSDTVTRFEQAIARLDEVLECHLMTGSSDYLLRVLVKDLPDYERFMRQSVHAIPGIASVDTSFSYGAVKEATVFSL